MESESDKKRLIMAKIEGIIVREFLQIDKIYEYVNEEEESFINFICTDDEIFGETRSQILDILKRTKERNIIDLSPEFELIIVCIKCREKLMEKLVNNLYFTLDDSDLINYLFKAAHNRRRKLEVIGKRLRRNILLDKFNNGAVEGQIINSDFLEYHKLPAEKVFMKEVSYKIMEDIVNTLKTILKAEDFKLLELRFCEEFSYKKIGERLGINENTARKKKFDILKRIKCLMERDGYFTREDYFALIN